MHSIEYLADLLESDDLQGFRAALAKTTAPELHALTFDDGKTTLLDFVLGEQQKLEFVTALLDFGLNPNHEHEATTPIVSAVCLNAPAPILAALIAAGGDPNLGYNGDGVSALTVAVDNEELEIVRLLLGAGAHVNETNNESQTPLTCACLQRNAALVSMLLDAGADPDLGPDGFFPDEAAGDDPAIHQLLAAARVPSSG